MICNTFAAIVGRPCPKCDTLFAGVCVPCVAIECPDELYFKITCLHAMFYENAHNTNVFCTIVDIRMETHINVSSCFVFVACGPSYFGHA